MKDLRRQHMDRVNLAYGYSDICVECYDRETEYARYKCGSKVRCTGCERKRYPRCYVRRREATAKSGKGSG